MKYIFIDSNQYRHIFSRSEGFSDSVHKLLIKLTENERVVLLLPQQTKDEVERNKYREWLKAEISSIESKIQKFKAQIDKAKGEFSSYHTFSSLSNEIKKEILKLEKEKDKISKIFTSNHSKSNKKLKKLFEIARFIEENEDIINKAQTRRQKGNPPYESSGIGDALIWESLIYYLSNQKGTKSTELIFVAHDKEAWGDDIFDEWLQNEFKKRIGGKIVYSKKLSDVPSFTKREQEEIRKKELENDKQNAVADFVNSQSFIIAGERARNLLKYKNMLGSNDYREIIKASVTNSQIYQSFFTRGCLLELVTGKDDYVVKRIESIDSELWRKFAEFYRITLKRQTDQQKQLIGRTKDKSIDIEDIPFSEEEIEAAGDAWIQSEIDRERGK